MFRLDYIKFLKQFQSFFPHFHKIAEKKPNNKTQFDCTYISVRKHQKKSLTKPLSVVSFSASF